MLHSWALCSCDFPRNNLTRLGSIVSTRKEEGPLRLHPHKETIDNQLQLKEAIFFRGVVIGKFSLLHSLPPMHGQVTLIKFSVCHAEGDISRKGTHEEGFQEDRKWDEGEKYG